MSFKKTPNSLIVSGCVKLVYYLVMNGPNSRDRLCGLSNWSFYNSWICSGSRSRCFTIIPLCILDLNLFHVPHNGFMSQLNSNSHHVASTRHASMVVSMNRWQKDNAWGICYWFHFYPFYHDTSLWKHLDIILEHQPC